MVLNIQRGWEIEESEPTDSNVDTAILNETPGWGVDFD